MKPSRRVKVLSLLQPWASLVVGGFKMAETRSWNSLHRGELLIHASKRPVAKRDIEFFEMQEAWHATGLKWNELPYSSILGQVVMTESIKFGSPESVSFLRGWMRWYTHQVAECAFGDWTAGRYGFIFERPVKYRHPMIEKGNLGIWDYELQVPLGVEVIIWKGPHITNTGFVAGVDSHRHPGECLVKMDRKADPEWIPSYNLAVANPETVNSEFL